MRTIRPQFHAPLIFLMLTQIFFSTILCVEPVALTQMRPTIAEQQSSASQSNISAQMQPQIQQIQDPGQKSPADTPTYRSNGQAQTAQQPQLVQIQPQVKQAQDSGKKTTDGVRIDQPSMPGQSQLSIPSLEKKSLGWKETRNTIDFTFDNVELSQMIKRYAQKKHVNVILPPIGLQEKITFRPSRLLTLAEAKKYLYLFLDYAGYTVLPGKDFVVAAKSKDAQRSRLPFYVFESDGKIKPTILPESDEFVRALFYFTNLKVNTSSDNSVTAILREVLSSPENAFVDPTLNGVIITDRSRIVRAALQLLQELDTKNPDYIIITLQLHNASAGSIAKLLMEQILSSPNRYSDSKTILSGTYFSTNIRVVADTRRNMLVIMGKEAAVNRLKNFIRDSLDAAPDTGKSIFHVYDLRYLDAESFAGVLENIIKSSRPDDQVSQEKTGGISRSFEGVSVKAEVYKAAEQASSQQSGFDFGAGSTSAGIVYRGGNRLLIAAQPSDWIQIKKLVEQLDVPQRQVIVEVLIVDYQHDTNKAIGTQIRNPQRFGLPEGVQFQAAHFSGAAGILTDVDCPDDGCTLGTNIVGDLLRYINTKQFQGTIIPAISGYSVLSLNDPDTNGIWDVWAILNQMGNTRVLSHPYVIALNNTPAQVRNSEIKRGEGAVATSSGAYNVAVEDIPASLAVTITPRIASADRLNLNIIVDITQFTSSGLDRNSRRIETNVNMNGKSQILVLGGLTKTNEIELGGQTPILGQIPLIGWLFKGYGMKKVETELGIFIRPIIIEPKLRETANEYTLGKIKKGIDRNIQTTAPDLDEGSRDPIIRLFFGEPTVEKDAVRDYLVDTHHKEMIP